MDAVQWERSRSDLPLMAQILEIRTIDFGKALSDLLQLDAAQWEMSRLDLPQTVKIRMIDWGKAPSDLL
jgi:hypothetical protein